MAGVYNGKMDRIDRIFRNKIQPYPILAKFYAVMRVSNAELDLSRIRQTSSSVTDGKYSKNSPSV